MVELSLLKHATERVYLVDTVMAMIYCVLSDVSKWNMK